MGRRENFQSCRRGRVGEAFEPPPVSEQKPLENLVICCRAPDVSPDSVLQVTEEPLAASVTVPRMQLAGSAAVPPVQRPLAFTSRVPPDRTGESLFCELLHVTAKTGGISEIMKFFCQAKTNADRAGGDLPDTRTQEMTLHKCHLRSLGEIVCSLTQGRSLSLGDATRAIFCFYYFSESGAHRHQAQKSEST